MKQLENAYLRFHNQLDEIEQIYLTQFLLHFTLDLTYFTKMPILHHKCHCLEVLIGLKSSSEGLMLNVNGICSTITACSGDMD